MVVNHLTELPEKSATKQKTRTALETIFREDIPEQGMDPLIMLSALFIFPLVSENDKE